MESDVKIPSRYRLRVKQRLAVVQYADIHGIKPASRHFGLARHTVRRWWRGWQCGGASGLVPRYPSRRKRRLTDHVIALIRQARTEHEYGAGRTRIWLSASIRFA